VLGCFVVWLEVMEGGKEQDAPLDLGAQIIGNDPSNKSVGCLSFHNINTV
jgi:hypothetical protein